MSGGDKGKKTQKQKIEERAIREKSERKPAKASSILPRRKKCTFLDRVHFTCHLWYCLEQKGHTLSIRFEESSSENENDLRIKNSEQSWF